MKKSVKRILCGALSAMMVSALAVEGALRMQADDAVQSVLANASGVSFKNVTGEYDTSKLRESYLNDSVLSGDTAPTYETRTVMVTLDGEPVIDRAGDSEINDYISSWSGGVAEAEIKAEQKSFLSALSKTGIPYTLERQYNTVINAVAIEVNTKYVSSIKKMSGVDSVVITTAYTEPKTQTNTGSGVVTNETDVYATGIYDSTGYASKYGAGQIVAILDTGLDYTHDAFQKFETVNVNDPNWQEISWQESDVAQMLAKQDLSAEARSGSLVASDVFVNDKVPFAYDYADDDADVYPSYSNHGTHVAGIIGGYDEGGYDDKDGNHINNTFKGVVPDAQLVICKVFTDDLDDPDLGGAVAEDIVAALDDCVKLGVDVINMSLGTSCGFTTTNDGDDEGKMLDDVYRRIQDAGISLVCAASNDYSSGYGGVYGTNLAENPDSSTVGSPSTFASALSVASINGQKASYMIGNEGKSGESYVFYEESRDIDGNPYDFAKQLLGDKENAEFEYAVVSDKGQTSGYTKEVKAWLKAGSNRLVLVERGINTFKEKVEIAMNMGAAGIIVYNNVAGVIRMNLGEIDNPIPAVSISMNAGNALVAAATTQNRVSVGKLKLDPTYLAGPFMSEFSSWGPTHDLTIKPEITAHGGEITSTVPGGYGEQSGTSMASPNMAGFMALVRGYIETELSEVVDDLVDLYTEKERAAGTLKQDETVSRSVVINRLAMQLTMSTAETAYDQDNKPYSPRKQGAGVARLDRVLGGEGVTGTTAYLWTDSKTNDYRPKIEVGDTPEAWETQSNPTYDLTFNVSNFGTSPLTFTPDCLAMTETLSDKGLTVDEQAHMFTDSTVTWKSGVGNDNKVTVGAGQTVTVTVTLALGDADAEYIRESFENGMYVEGFLKLKSDVAGQCDLSVPFLGFYGDWDNLPMLDYTAFEVAESQQKEVDEAKQLKASVWATQPYSMYYNEKYILPMGGYVYLLPDDADPVYVNEDYCAISRYNEYYGEGVAENYLTSTGIKAVYAGLLRNARIVKYRMYNEETGELILEDEINRVGKAYAGGGSATPANVELEIRPEETGLVGNGKYRMEFEFYKDKPEDGEVAPEENTYEFTFTVDYEAPILEDARVRYYNYEENNKAKQRIYLDLDVYDNHYAQALMLCYPKLDSEGDVTLQIATEYPTPIRNANKNGKTTVSIEITDIYEKYGNQLYVQLDDYAVNTCLYQLNINESNADILPDTFELGEGENNITLDIYGTHKTSLVYSSDSADDSNFLWTSANPGIADVKNGEIVGLGAGKTQILVSNRKGVTKKIDVTVTNTKSATLPSVPNISFGLIKTDTDSLAKANGYVTVNAGKNFRLTIETDPWYHPMTDLRIKWSSGNTTAATVDEYGNVQTFKRGTTNIKAVVEKQNAKGVWEETLYSATVTLRVQNEFTVSNYTLTDYNGVGGVVTIPTDMNIWYIGEEAFKDNDNITKIIIPSSVIQINERAFQNCTALEEVYFVSENHREDGNGNILDAEIDWSDLSMIYEHAFEGCKKLRKVDFSNVKTATVAMEAFANCSSLSEVLDMPSIGTMHHRAFANCALTSVDLTGLHMSGEYVFAGNPITEIQTGRFTAIGNYMFAGCTALVGEEDNGFTGITLNTGKIGTGAFRGCTSLKGVRFATPDGEEAISFDIGARAFENCSALTTAVFGTEIIRSIADRAFAGTGLAAVPAMNGLQAFGADVFANTAITALTINDDFDLTTLRLLGVPFNGITVTLENGYSGEKYALVNNDPSVIYNKALTKILYVAPTVEGTFELPTAVTGLTAIGEYAFAYSKITAIELPATLETVGAYAFAYSDVKQVNFLGSNGALTEIPEGAFYGSRLDSIALPDSVTTLGNSAFEGAALTSFTGDGLTTLGNRVFANNIVLQTIDLPSGITTMGDETFAGCTGLKSAILPAVTQLGAFTFNGCTALENASFDSGAQGTTTVTGTYTFAGTPVKSVGLATSIEKIGEGFCYDCKELRAVDLGSQVREIGAYAFENTTALERASGLDEVRTIGDRAFYNSGIEKSQDGADATIQLTNAVSIGAMAFATQTNSKTNYTAIELGAVETIGDFAFLNSSIAAVELPATLKTLGYGAFASSDNLTAFTVASGNNNFFVEDGVLYRYIDKAEGIFELVAYPTAKAADGAKGDREYAVKEGTAAILAYAFYDLNAGMLDGVVLPYTLNTVGDSAFFASGIKEYTFESIQAPTLETVYRSEIADSIKAVSTIAYYKGYYYANFETYLFNFTSYVGEKSELIINYPTNGRGYTNHIYSLYFGTKNAMGVYMEDNTRECIKLIDEMPDAATISAWTAATVDKAEVERVAANVKTARSYFNNAKNNAQQADFLSAEAENKLLAVEKALRGVKPLFGISVEIAELKLDSTCVFKSEYTVGETFDMTGVVVIIVYDDGSEEVADSSKLTLETTKKLGKYDRTVDISYAGFDEALKVRITVTEEKEEAPETPNEDETTDDSAATDSASSSTKKGGCSGTIGFAGAGVALVLGGAAVAFRKKKED
ncbi:MAG: leucine-rich repeat protein [Clostridia bacterium]|nr:leucine-rich repeat protein [Clostridia bacterium]